MLVKGALSADIQKFVTELNKKEQKDLNIVIKKFSDNMEDNIYKAIKKLQITIPPGTIIVLGGNGGGPVTCTNAAPIVIQNAIT